MEVVSRRGRVLEKAKVGDIEPGVVFIPFHYGYWDESERPRAANELTITEWDPVSKQPHFKYAAVRIRKVESIPERVADAIAQVVNTVKTVLNQGA